MSKSKTKEVETALGTVKVETVECDSCGQRIQEENARKFSIEGGKKGYACQMCADDPVSFPPTIDFDFNCTDNNQNFRFGDCLVLFFTLPVLQLVLLETLEKDAAKMITTAIMSTMFWTVLSIVLFGGFL